ncbi:MAG: ribokinase [Chloroflexales bacterium]|nr:ribokinase [Chloroflexales bacterium]
MPHPTVCVVGSVNMDLVVRTPALPAPGQTILGGPFNTFPGGKGANQAVAAARAGGQVALIAAVGADAYGPALRTGLADEGVDVAGVQLRSDAATGIALIAVDPLGQNTIIVAPGANATLSSANVEQAAAVIQASAVLLLQLEVPLPAVTAAARIARAAGTRVVLNPAPAAPLDDVVLALADVLVPNETEAAALCNLQPGDGSSAEHMAYALRRRGPRAVVITLGDRGVLLLDEDAKQVIHQPPFVVPAIDATAAGDAFIGALAVALAEHRPLHEAVRWGAAAGALAATIAGAQPSLPLRAQIETMLASGLP